MGENQNTPNRDGASTPRKQFLVPGSTTSIEDLAVILRFKGKDPVESAHDWCKRNRVQRFKPGALMFVFDDDVMDGIRRCPVKEVWNDAET